ncbi:porin [Buchnera aphidicola]|uniref:porin n=1 Tax=Buchnera aphidicola TaxID=9 RepID=UPI00346397F5
MINRQSLAILIPLCLYSGNVHAEQVYHNNTINVYSQINPLHFYSHTTDPLIINSLGNYSNIKLGFFNQYYINEKNFGYARFEYCPRFIRYNPENYSHVINDNVGLAYVGINLGDWGSIDYGRNYGVMHYSKRFTEKFFNDSENIVFHDDDNFLLGRADGVLSYKSRDFAGYMSDFNFILQHQTHYQKKHYYLSNKYNDSWGIALNYINHFGLKISGTAFFSPYDNSRNGANLHSHWAKSYGLGCSYNVGNVSFAGFYGFLKNSAFPYMKDSVRYDLLDTFEIGGKYNFQNGITASLGYVKSFGTEYDYMRNVIVSQPKPLNNHFNVIMNYEINKHFTASFHYKLNLLKESNSPDQEYIHYAENSFGFGMNYFF